MTLSAKLAAAIAFVVGIFGVGAVVLMLSQQEDERRTVFRRTHRESLQLLALAIAPAVSEGRHERVQAALDNVANFPERYPDVVGVEVIDREGRVLADLDPRRFGTRYPLLELQHDLALKTAEIRRAGPARFLFAIPVRLAHGLGVVRAVVSEERLVASLRGQRVLGILGAFGVVFAMALALYGLLRRIVGSRVERLAEVADRLGRGERTARAVEAGGDEIARLGKNFNRMADALAAYTTHLEELVSERTRELENANARLELLATTDPLTGLLNRRRFAEQAGHGLDVARRGERPFAVVLMDVDHFKRINDRFGHPVGDEALRFIARVLGEGSRSTDVVARVGGEEFAVAMPDTSLEEALRGAERLRVRLCETRCESALVTDDLHITASFGVAAFRRDGDSIRALLRAADRALYRAKRTGRNRVVAAQDTGDTGDGSGQGAQAG